jgi:hypothetical protein
VSSAVQVDTAISNLKPVVALILEGPVLAGSETPKSVIYKLCNFIWIMECSH